MSFVHPLSAAAAERGRDRTHELRQLEICAAWLEPNIFTLPPSVAGVGATLLMWCDPVAVTVWTVVTATITALSVYAARRFLRDPRRAERFELWEWTIVGSMTAFAFSLGSVGLFFFVADNRLNNALIYTVLAASLAGAGAQSAPSPKVTVAMVATYALIFVTTVLANEAWPLSLLLAGLVLSFVGVVGGYSRSIWKISKKMLVSESEALSAKAQALVDRDATEAANRALKLRDDLLTGLAANIDGVLFRTRLGPPTVMEYYSPGIKKHIGIDAADLIGKAPIGESMTYDEDRERYQRTVLSALKHNQPYEIEYRLVLPGGHVKWVLESGRTTAFDSDGKPMIMEGMSIDITSRKATETAVADARDMAEAASSAKSEFLAMMSHEIRTPMNGVLGMTSVLLDTSLTTEQRRSAATIRESAESLLGIINDVLDFSKLEAKAMDVECVAFDLHALLSYAKDIVTPRAAEKSISIRLDIASDVPRFVRADPGRIRQIVLNLLGNAVKFTERGSVTLKVRGRAMEAEGDVALRLDVVDTGIGIPADRLDRLFRRFSQTDASMSRKFGGTGLGLAISKKLVELMGGEIGVDSTPGQGSTFWFEVPVKASVSSDVETSEIEAEEEQLKTAVDAIAKLGRPLRLLVAEDNATNQLVVKSVLAKYGIVPDCVGNGIEAIEALRRRSYDVVLMDVHMPDMDGLAATRAIRAADGPQSKVPIVALTANAFARDIDDCLAAGMNSHVGKPFRTERLLIALGDALRSGGRVQHADNTPELRADDLPDLDLDAIARFRDDAGEEMLTLLLETYLDDATSKLEQLARIATMPGTNAEAVRLAHSLKSASAMACAAAMSNLAASVEHDLRSGPQDVTPETVRALRLRFERYRAALVAQGLAA